MSGERHLDTSFHLPRLRIRGDKVAYVLPFAG